MTNKKDHPQIESEEWITVDGQDCVVVQIYKGYSFSGVCEVVTNPSNPENRDVCWDGQNWIFSERETFLNAAPTPRLKDFVAILQRGRNSDT